MLAKNLKHCMKPRTLLLGKAKDYAGEKLYEGKDATAETLGKAKDYAGEKLYEGKDATA
ncbi:unnamed protein product, partial [Strongylus vulgaris]